MLLTGVSIPRLRGHFRSLLPLVGQAADGPWCRPLMLYEVTVTVPLVSYGATSVLGALQTFLPYVPGRAVLSGVNVGVPQVSYVATLVGLTVRLGYKELNLSIEI